MGKKTVCLSMIVKNESDVIERCLESVLPMIDSYLISDTGSTDNTIELIENFFKKNNIPGKVISHEWKNFAFNRTLALEEIQKLEDKPDYILVIDADDMLKYDDDFKLEDLTADQYMMKIINYNIVYYRPHLINNKLDWRWESVVHEYLTCSHASVVKDLVGVTMYIGSGGARSKHTNKFLGDIKLLKKALVDEPDNTRYTFYLAQSYRDSGNNDKAIKYYKKRAELKGFDEEVYLSLYNVGLCMIRRGDPFEEISGALLKAYNNRPHRIEALHELVKYCRINGQYIIGHYLGLSAIDKPQSSDILFVDKIVHDYALKDEVSLCAHYHGDHAYAVKLGEEILAEKKYPDNQLDRLTTNLIFFKKSLGV